MAVIASEEEKGRKKCARYETLEQSKQADKNGERTAQHEGHEVVKREQANRHGPGKSGTDLGVFREPYQKLYQTESYSTSEKNHRGFASLLRTSQRGTSGKEGRTFARRGGELGKHNTAQQLTNETRLIQDTITES